MLGQKSILHPFHIFARVVWGKGGQGLQWGEAGAVKLDRIGF